MITKAKRKLLSLIITVIMIITSVANVDTSIYVQAADTSTKEQIVSLQFASTANETSGILKFPDSLPYTNDTLGVMIDTNATYGINSGTATTLKATNWVEGKYWLFGFAPKGYENLTLSFMPRSSNTGPRDFKVQYSTDNNTWLDVDGSSYVVTSSYDVTQSFHLPVTITNVDHLYVRMIVTSNISARAGTGTYSPTDQIQSGGVNNIGTVVLSGTKVNGGGTVTVEPVTSNYPSESIVDKNTPIILSSPSVTTGSAITLTNAAIDLIDSREKNSTVATGSAIKISVNGNEFHTYQGPFTLADYGADDTNTEFTITAFAQVNGITSATSSFHYYTKDPNSTTPTTVPDPITDDMVKAAGASTINDVYAMVSGGTATVIGQVAYQYGNVYNNANSINTIIIQDVISDEIVGLQIYDTSHTYNVGDIVVVTGKVGDYGKVRQISGVTSLSIIETKEPFKAQELTINELLNGGDKYLSEYVFIKGVTLGTYSSTSNTLVTDATGSVNLYKGALLPDGLLEGQVINLYAAWSKYNTTYQLRNGLTTDYVILSTGDTVDTSIVLPIASWAGTGENPSAMVYADKYAANDFLDTAAYLTLSSGKPPVTTISSGNYSIGSKGSLDGAYYQLDFSSKLYGNIQLNYSMRGSNTGPKNFKILYSADGSEWIQATTTDLSISTASTWEKFSTTLPVGANNITHLSVRIQVAGSTSINNGTIGSSGTNYINEIKLTGSPVVSNTIVGYPVISPNTDEVRMGDEITISSSTTGATIYYSFDDVTYQVYDNSKKPVFKTLPNTIFAYATKQGLTDSLKIIRTYTQGQVEPVKASPNGGAKPIGTKVSLTSTTGAIIWYSFDGGATWNQYQADNKIVLENLPITITAKATMEGYKDSQTSEFKFTKRENDSYNIYFGQIHSHTEYSDGAGTCDQAFNYAKNTAKQLDFLAVTDHSNSFDNADKATLLDGSVSEEWKEGHALADKYTDTDFVSLYGYEMTWSNGLGHINTFNTDGFQSRTGASYNTYSTALQNYYATLKTDTESISQFNHPGTTFGDFSDFDHYDAEIDNLITLIEVGNGEGAIGSSGYFPSYEYYTRALDKGWHVSPTNNQDNHKGNWGDSNTARTVILADSLTRDNIYDALRNMRTYATEDNDLEINYTLNGEIMGTILEQTPENAEIAVSLKDPTDEAIGKVEVIVNGGLSIAEEVIATNEATVKFNLPVSYSYYYIKVTEPDRNIAVTAPVWVSEVESVGISSISTTAALPVKGEALDINTQIYNNEAQDLLIESMTFTIGDEVIHTVDLATAGLNKIASYKTGAYSFYYTYNDVGTVEIKVTINATLNGVNKVYQSILKLTYVDPSMVTNVVVDGTHYNDYVTGYYGANMNNFTDIAAGENIKVNIIKDKMTEEILSDCDLLIISAPAKKSGTANAGAYTVSHFEDEFIQLVKSYTEKGGTVILCGIADYQDSADAQTSTEMNKLLAAIGATTRINSDEAMDDNENGGQAYRLYLTNYNTSSEYTSGVVKDQKYSAYSGCTLVLDQASVDLGKVEYLIKGHPTTYSIDSKSFDGNYTPVAKGETIMLAREKLDSGTNLFIASTVFMSDFEVKVELDNIWDLPYINKTVIVNILDSVKKTTDISNIADVRSGKMGDIFCVEGIVTAGTVDGNAFFDTIYIQDETGGINIFPINEGLIEVGQKVKVTGYLDQYLGDLELRVITAEVTSVEKNPISPTLITTKDSMDYNLNGGKLVKVQGKVTNVTKKNNIVETIVVKDTSGVEARIFIDGYIRYSDSTSKTLESIAIVGNEISAIGLVSYDPEGERIRVRDRSEIVLVKVAEPENPDNPSNNNSDNTGDTSVVTDTTSNTQITTTITQSFDSNGNLVVTTLISKVDLKSKDTIETTTQVVTTDRNTGSHVTTTIVRNKNSEVIKASALVVLTTSYNSTEHGAAVLQLGVLADPLVKAARESTEKVPLSVSIRVESERAINQLRDSVINQVKMLITIPSLVRNNNDIVINEIIIDDSIIKTAKTEKKNIIISIVDESGKETYSFKFDGNTLSESKNKVTDVNLQLEILPVTENVKINNRIRPFMAEGVRDQGVIFDFSHSGILPATTRVRAYVGNKSGLRPGSQVYIYYFNEQDSSKLKKQKRLEEGKTVTAVIDSDGYIEFDIIHCSSYVVLPAKPDSKIVVTYIDQVEVPTSKTLYVGKTYKLNITLPVDATDVTISYKSSNKDIATINKSGKITAIKSGTVTITTKVTINGVTKSFKTKIKVKVYK